MNTLPAVGLEPHDPVSGSDAVTTQDDANLLQFNALDGLLEGAPQQADAVLEQNGGTSEHQSYVPSMYADPALTQIVRAWPRLTVAQKDRILNIVNGDCAAPTGT